MSIRVPITGVLNDKQAHALTLKLAYSMEGIFGCTYDEINREILIESENEANTEYLLGIVHKMILEEKEIRAMGSRLIRTQDQQKQTYPKMDQLEMANDFVLNGTMKKNLQQSCIPYLICFFKASAKSTMQKQKVFLSYTA